MGIGGGVRTRRTWEGGTALVVGWTPDGQVLYTTRAYSTLPNQQLATIDVKTGMRTLVPLGQASDGSYDPTGKTLFFTRPAFHGSHTKPYQAGTRQTIWQYATAAPEALPLTSDYPGTSK